MRGALLTLLALSALLAGAPGCAGEPPPEAPLRPLGHAARGGSLIIDHQRLWAWAADADNHALHRVDLVSAEVVSSALDGAPEQVVLVDDHHLAVTVRDRNEVELLEIDAEGAAHAVARTEVAVDPFGLALTPQGELLVTSAWSHTLSALDAETLAPRWTADLAREPRAVVVSNDGARAFITHLAGNSISIVELEPEVPIVRRAPLLGGLHRNRVDRSLGADTLRPTAALAYAAVISDAGARLFVPQVIEQNGSSTSRSVPFAYGGVPVDEDTSQASVAVIMVQGERLLGPIAGGAAPVETLGGAASIAPEGGLGVVIPPGAAPARQGRAVALLGERLLVASQGTNELIELDARAFDPAMSVRRRFAVGEGPKGVEVDASTRTAVVWSQLSHEVAIVALDSGAVERLRVAGDPLPPEIAAGRRLFFTELDRRITRDGRSCAGCHPEGRDDGVVWKLGAGPRQTPTLLGRLSRGPYGWLGKHATLEGNMVETISRLGGTGLPDADLRKLAAYLQKGLITPTLALAEPAADALVDQGRALFRSEQVGCSGCHHLDTELSDRSLHDVGSYAKTDGSRSFRTPPLLHVGHSAPYFHDGRYATLEQLLDDNLDRMGQTTQLSPAELRALAAFLRTL
jgi:DNA-binding beta-propeller fold protein YncE/cytochrome c553